MFFSNRVKYLFQYELSSFENIIWIRNCTSSRVRRNIYVAFLFVSTAPTIERGFSSDFFRVFRSDLLFLLLLRIFFVFPQPYFAELERSYFMWNNNNAINPILAHKRIYTDKIQLRKRLPNYRAAETKLFVMGEILVRFFFFAFKCVCVSVYFSTFSRPKTKRLASFGPLSIMTEWTYDARLYEIFIIRVYILRMNGSIFSVY